MLVYLLRLPRKVGRESILRLILSDLSSYYFTIYKVHYRTRTGRLLSYIPRSGRRVVREIWLRCITPYRVKLSRLHDYCTICSRSTEGIMPHKCQKNVKKRQTSPKSLLFHERPRSLFSKWPICRAESNASRQTGTEHINSSRPRANLHRCHQLLPGRVYPERYMHQLKRYS